MTKRELDLIQLAILLSTYGDEIHLMQEHNQYGVVNLTAKTAVKSLLRKEQTRENL